MRKLLCKENLIYVVIVISVILVYLIRIIKSTISIDTEAYIASPSTIINSWDSISRISLGILKNLFNNINYYYLNCKDESIVFIGNTKYKVLNGEMLGN